MASDFVALSFLQRLAAVWTQTAVIERHQFLATEAATTPFLIVHFPPSATTRITIGPAGEFEEAGVALLRLIAPIEYGSAYIRQGLDALSALLLERVFPSGADAPVHTETPFESLVEEEPVGNWLIGQVSVPFYRRNVR